MIHERQLWQGDSEYAHYEVAEQQYNHRPARLLFSGRREAVQSGIALDDQPELLFDYNQRFLELARSMRPRRVLLIGGGAFTLPMALLTELVEIQLDVVERDELLLQVAEAHFGFRPNARLNVYFADGRTFLETCAEPYDLILVDAFSHLHIPASLSTVEAVAAMRRSTTRQGIVAVNIVSPYYGRMAAVIRRQLMAYRTAFERVEVFSADATDSGWQQQNLVLVASAAAASTAKHMRFDPLPPLDLAHDRPLTDATSLDNG